MEQRKEINKLKVVLAEKSNEFRITLDSIELWSNPDLSIT